MMLRRWLGARYRAAANSYDVDAAQAASNTPATLFAASAQGGLLAIIGYVPYVASRAQLMHPGVPLVLTALAAATTITAGRRGCQGRVGVTATLLDNGLYSAALVFAAVHVTESWGVGIAIVHGFMVLAFGAQVYGLTLAYALVMLAPYVVSFALRMPSPLVALVLVSTYVMTLFSSFLTARRLLRSRRASPPAPPTEEPASPPPTATSAADLGRLKKRTVIAERYRVGDRLAAGGFGVVYDAEDLLTGEACALKLLYARGDDDLARLQRLLREVSIAASINSPYVVKHLGAGLHGNVPFLAMERLRGEDLARRLARTGPFPSDEVVRHLRDVSRGLDAAHARDVIHRDLKPSNLFLIEREHGPASVKILDFGTARLLDMNGGQTTALAGTPVFMAPEQFEGASLDQAADIYALGMCAFQLLVGKHFYERERSSSANPFSLAALLVRGVPETASSRAARYGETLPASFDAWFAQCTALAPRDRFERATQAIDALELAMGATAEHGPAEGETTPRPD